VARRVTLSLPEVNDLGIIGAGSNQIRRPLPEPAGDLQDHGHTRNHLIGFDLLDGARRDATLLGELLQGEPGRLSAFANTPADVPEFFVDGLPQIPPHQAHPPRPLSSILSSILNSMLLDVLGIGLWMESMQRVPLAGGAAPRSRIIQSTLDFSYCITWLVDRPAVSRHHPCTEKGFR